MAGLAGIGSQGINDIVEGFEKVLDSGQELNSYTEDAPFSDSRFQRLI